MSVVRRESRVISARALAAGTVELTLERAGMTFCAGQEIIVHGSDPQDDRTYSIASGESDDWLILLIRVIPHGTVSPRLAALRAGDPIAFSGPTGSFTLRDPKAPCLFVATGTGIAPFRSFLRTYPDLRPVLLHGVRTPSELYWRGEIEPRCERYLPCISRDPDHPRRVTDLLRELALPEGAHAYLCGGNPMIREARDVLLRRGVPADAIRGEPYYFW